MKKTLFVIAIAAILVVAMTGSAFATMQSRYTNKGAASTGQGADAYTYMSWALIEGYSGNAGYTSPHGGYGTTTEKCAVCHSVHVAAPSNGVVNANIPNTTSADTLLRVKASDACLLCHMSASNSVSTPVASWTPNGGPHSSASCGECHTGPHGAGADTAPPVVSLILKANPSTFSQQTSQYATYGYGIVNTSQYIDNNNAWVVGGGVTGFTPAQYASTANATNDTVRQQAVGVFCAECHESSFSSVVSGAAANANGFSSAYNAVYSGHRTQATLSTDWGSSTSGNIHSSSASTATGMQIAWAPATNCYSCHDASNGYGDFAFPHGYGPVANQRWLLSAASKTSSTQGSAISLEDGVCLKCHRSGSGAATTGVGLSY